MTRQEAIARGRHVHEANAQGRREDYAELRSWGLTRRQAAERLGVNLRTIVRYEATLRERAA